MANFTLRSNSVLFYMDLDFKEEERYWKKQASGSSETLCRRTTPLIPNAMERKMDVPFELLTVTGFISLPVLSEWISCWILQTLTPI